jgi:hypothetical protein
VALLAAFSRFLPPIDPRKDLLMNWKIAAVFAAGLAVGCAANGPSTTAKPASPAAEKSPMGNPFSDRPGGGLAASLQTPLVIDRADLRIGTTVQFDHLPTASELNDLNQLLGIAHVVLSLPTWPDNLDQLKALDYLPEETDVIVILPDYPPSRAAAEAWNYLGSRIRMIVVVDQPPVTAAVVNDLNTMRHLERVIAQMDMPSRSGFERLQAPLSFRKIVR